jgi:serine/threonine protein kinase
LSEEFPVQLAGLSEGSRLARYRIEVPLGAGGMAVVYRAHDERLKRLVALKVFAPIAAGDRFARQRFINESRAAAAVDHEHIIPIYEADEARGSCSSRCGSSGAVTYGGCWNGRAYCHQPERQGSSPRSRRP